MTDPNSNQPPRVVGWMGRINGLFIIVGAIAIGSSGSLVLWNLAQNIRENPESADNVAAFALACIEHRAWLPALALPPLVCGILLAANRTRRSFWLVFGAATVWLILLFALILYCFLMFLAPLYQYQPI